MSGGSRGAVGTLYQMMMMMNDGDELISDHLSCVQYVMALLLWLGASRGGCSLKRDDNSQCTWRKIPIHNLAGGRIGSMPFLCRKYNDWAIWRCVQGRRGSIVGGFPAQLGWASLRQGEEVVLAGLACIQCMFCVIFEVVAEVAAERVAFSQ